MKILMRGAIDPLRFMRPEKFIIENHTGGNIGNMLFIYSIERALLTDENTQIDFVNTARRELNKAYADYVNEHYDVFLLPLANAFKKSFYAEMVKLTKFIKMLKIPCHIIGVGIQQMLHGAADFSSVYPYNEEVKAFVGAVLEKSPRLGLRGAVTADYLKRLGFLPERDFTVIGCPSLFTYGDTLPEAKPLALNENSVVAFNSKIEFEENDAYAPYLAFCKRNAALFPNAIYVPQQINDIRATYLDTLSTDRMHDRFFDSNSAVSFTNVPAWTGYFHEQVDFSFGSRIHGNVAAILGGVPAVTVPFDKRVFELADYHNIPMVLFDGLKDGATLYDICGKADFSSIQKGHRERFAHYCDFLHTLELPTIYDAPQNDAPLFDRILQTQEPTGVIRAYGAISEEERTARYRDGFTLYKKKFEEKQSTIEKKNDEIKALKQQLRKAKAAPPEKEKQPFLKRLLKG